MKKHLLRLLALLCVLSLTFSLCGCGILNRLGLSSEQDALAEKKSWSFLDFSFLRDFFKPKTDNFHVPTEQLNPTEAPAPTEATEPAETTPAGTFLMLAEETAFRAEPSWDSPVCARLPAGSCIYFGQTVSLDGRVWAYASDGWFVLEGTQPADILSIDDDEQHGVIIGNLDAYAEPDVHAPVQVNLDAGSVVYISQIASTADGTWGKTPDGWIPYAGFFRLDNLSQIMGYGVVRDRDARFYNAASIYSGVCATPASGSRHTLLAEVDINNMTWYYTTDGWIPADSVYKEGTIGWNSCYVKIIDPTPLNVRLAPGTQNEVLTTMLYGEYTDILEQVYYNNSLWGYTGTGWIFMDLTEIQ